LHLVFVSNLRKSFYELYNITPDGLIQIVILVLIIIIIITLLTFVFRIDF